MPLLRPFRALRYDPAAVRDLSDVISPPYDVISPGHRQVLLGRDPHNAVRVELPERGAGETEDEPYRGAARAFVAWRSEGVLRKDPRPSIYLYEQRYRVPGVGTERTQRGFFARLRLEPFGPESGVRPHERTLDAPKLDRLRLLRACGVNLSPVVGLYESDDAQALVDRLAEAEPDAQVRDDEDVLHRLWVCPADDPDRRELVSGLLASAGRGPITIADGHHRYETCLRYREERGRRRACESDPAYDYVMCLLFDAGATPLTVLPTHRLVHRGPSGRQLLEAAGALFDVQPCSDEGALLGAFEQAAGVSPDAPRFAVWTDGLGAILRGRRDALEPLVSARADAVRWLDVSVLEVALERLLGLDTRALAEGEVSFTKDAAEAIGSVREGAAESAFLLHPTPVAAIIAAARAGEVMPQKSSFFYPKAATGLVFNPLES